VLDHNYLEICFPLEELVMTKAAESLAKKLGATVVGTVPDYSAGVLGMSALADTLQHRLEPSVGKRLRRQSAALRKQNGNQANAEH
jgi:hypothetical protein